MKSGIKTGAPESFRLPEAPEISLFYRLLTGGAAHVPVPDEPAEAGAAEQDEPAGAEVSESRSPAAPVWAAEAEEAALAVVAAAAAVADLQPLLPDG